MAKSKDPKPPTPPVAHGHASAAAPTDDGQAAFEKIRDRLTALHPRDLLAPTVDLNLVVPAVLGVAAQLKDPTLHARLHLLPTALFDASQIELLEPAAWAAWYVNAQTKKQRALSTDALVPAELGKEANELEARMQACCEYYFNDDPKIGPELARLRPGTGYQDLAEDLQGYGAIFRSEKTVIEHDRKNYRAGDADLAFELARRIIEALGSTPATLHGDSADLLSRAWTFLQKTYTDVIAAALFVQRQVSPLPVYPSLFTIGRPGAGRAAAKKGDGKGDGTTASEATPSYGGAPAGGEEPEKEEPPKQ